MMFEDTRPYLTLCKPDKNGNISTGYNSPEFIIQLVNSVKFTTGLVIGDKLESGSELACLVDSRYPRASDCKTLPVNI